MKFLICVFCLCLLGCRVEYKYESKPYSSQNPEKIQVKPVEIKPGEALPEDKSEMIPDDAGKEWKFIGKPDPKPITWDLWGDWEITGLEHEFKESWHPRKTKDKKRWFDNGRAETFVLVHGNVGDHIIWTRYLGRKFIMSINRQSYGLLEMTDENNNKYLAIRKEGGD